MSGFDEKTYRVIQEVAQKIQSGMKTQDPATIVRMIDESAQQIKDELNLTEIDVEVVRIAIIEAIKSAGA